MNVGPIFIRIQVVELKSTLQKCNAVMANIGCQLDKIWNLLGAKSPWKTKST